MAEIPLVDDEAVEEGGSVEVDFAGRPVLLFRKNGKVHAYVNVCTHLGGPCELRGDELVCQWHDSRFDAATGVAKTPPAPEGSRLIRLPVKLKDGKWYYSYP